MVIIHSVTHLGVYTTIDIELVDQQRVDEVTIVLGGILREFGVKHRWADIYKLTLHKFPFLKNGRHELKFNRYAGYTFVKDKAS